MENKVIQGEFKHRGIPEGSAKEADGCPTEKAVLQRYWREKENRQPYAYTYMHIDGKRMWRMASSRITQPESGWTETPLYD